MTSSTGQFPKALAGRKTRRRAVSDFCPKCKKLNRCDVGSKACWCLRYPFLQALAEASGIEYSCENSCLCEKCMKDEVSRQIDGYVERFKRGEVKNIAPKIAGRSDKPIEGIDYYMENGRWVFTSWSHLKRGYCCGSGCRHCPYPKEKEPKLSRI